MTTRKEEDRNEKVIRGLLKLPPNRRCINCNSLGPQYVCTNFWTFVCTTCSGIHREFTHRVKSVSMATFTSQEVEALQNGGNQRAREIYLKDWDLQKQRLPNSSNVDKVREFIMNVYADKKYAGGKTSEKPPLDAQSLKSQEKETRRASSYHSYSQSPPYDYQYEDRRYGKQAPVLTRKPGSDRGLYDGNSRFVYSPGRLSEQMYEDQFSNEGSVSRVSDYSTSSGVDPFRSGTQSPNFQKELGFSSPPIQPSSTNRENNADGIPCPQRSASSGSFGSFESNSMSLTSVNSGTSSAPTVDLFQSSSKSPASSMNIYQPTENLSSTTLDFFARQQSTAILDEKSPELSEPKNEGWATFDSPQPTASIPSTETLFPPKIPYDNRESLSSLTTSIHWLEDLHSLQAPTIGNHIQSWNAFEDSVSDLPYEAITPSCEPEVPAQHISSTTDQNLASNIPEDPNMDGIRKDDSHAGLTGQTASSHVTEQSYAPSLLLSMGETQPHAIACKSTNPFDLPYDSELEHSNMFLDMSSLQTALPNTQLSSSFLDNLSQPWFHQNSLPTYIPAAPQGTLAFMAGQASISPIQNVPAQESVASVGGNPFA